QFSNTSPQGKLLKREGDKLRVVNKAQMTFLDKMITWFGFGGYRLHTIVELLQSDRFCKKLQETTLTAKQRLSLETAAHFLDRKIFKYNRNTNSTFRLLFLFSIRLPYSIVHPSRKIIVVKNSLLSNSIKSYIVDANPDEYNALHSAKKETHLTFPNQYKLLNKDIIPAKVNAGRLVITDKGNVCTGSKAKEGLSAYDINRAYLFQEQKKAIQKIADPDSQLFRLVFANFPTKESLDDACPTLM